MTGKASSIATVHLGAADIHAAGDFLALVSGTKAVADDDTTIRVPLGDANIIIHPTTPADRQGLIGIELIVSRATAPARLNQTDVLFSQASFASTSADVELDHVAIVVADLESSAEAWRTAIGTEVEIIANHPVSAGTFRAARLLIGDRMIELVSPVPGKESGVSKRLNRSGEGPLVLALPAEDLDRKRRELEDAGVTLFWQTPHWFVHPANPAGLLIQLTPRVEHD